MEYLIIFLAKIVEVSLMTLRTVFISKGKRLEASIIGFVEVLIWLKVVSVVLIGISEDPYKMFSYAFGFAIGSYVGVWLEEKLAIGLVTVQVIVDGCDGQELAKYLRQKNIGVTLMNAYGKENDKHVLILYIQRKMKDEVIREIEETVENAVITISEVQKVHGGFGLLRK